MLINKILRKLGLIKINRVVHLSSLLHQHYVASVNSAIYQDFGVLAKPDASVAASKWWNKEIGEMILRDENDLCIITEPNLLP